MSGVNFGKELKILRNKVGFSSKVLSNKVGKAVTYVSQLERGLIKNPDYDTCKKILAELGISDSEAENMLDFFSIKSPEQEQAELEWSIKKAEEEQAKHESGYYSRRLQKISNKNDRLLQLLGNRFNNFVMYDQTRAEGVLDNLIKLLEEEETFDFFFCSLFKNNYMALSEQERSKVLSLVNDYVMEKNNENFFNLTDEGEDE
jgi:transcriptional regulator with XRE-family HTH domain